MFPMLVALIVALLVVVAVGIIAWSRTRGDAPAAKPLAVPKGECPDCGTAFVPKTDTKCSKCGRNLEGLSPSMRRLPSATDDEDDDPLARTVVKSGRPKTQCQSCGAALEGNTECPKCGAKQA
jgi:hypothetical protein